METKTVQEFISAINEHDVNKIGPLLTEDHVFTDAHNSVVKGKQEMLAGWKAYFEWFPDYKIEVVQMIAGNEAIALFGFAEGTFNTSKTNKADAHWRLPVSWRAVVRENKIAEWQVYADTKIPSEIMQKYEAKESEPNKVLALGGVFFKSKDAGALSAWYDKHLGTKFGEHGYMSFDWREKDNKEKTGATAFSIFKDSTKYLEPSKSSFMLNLRVSNVEAFLAKLKAEGVHVFDKVESYDYGKFGWIMDPDGNKIELWEPAEE